MLGKLLKYEWNGLRSPLLVILIIMGITTFMACAVILSIRPEYNNNLPWYSGLAIMLSFLLYYFGLIGCSLGSTIIIAIRFYKTCYTDQGYLTHTLPVSTQKIFNAKLLASVGLVFITLISILLSVFIIGNVGLNHFISISIAEHPEAYASVTEARRAVMQELSFVFESFEEELGISFGAYIAYLIVYVMISMVTNVVIILGCVSLGQLYSKHRIAGAIIAYFATTFIMQIIVQIFTIPMYFHNFNDTDSVFSVLSPLMNFALFFIVIIAIFMYFASLHMMSKKLNLE